MKQETNMEHSAEWLRGAVAVARDVREPLAVAHYTKLLAAAEAREASQPTAAEVISKVRAELLKCLDNAKTLPQDARQAGVVAGWESAIDLLEALCDGSIMDTVKPSAAEVIRVAKVALVSWRDGMNTHGEWDDGCFYYAKHSASELESRIEGNDKALAAIAAWEANNDR